MKSDFYGIDFPTKCPSLALARVNQDKSIRVVIRIEVSGENSRMTRTLYMRVLSSCSVICLTKPFYHILSCGWMDGTIGIIEYFELVKMNIFS